MARRPFGIQPLPVPMSTNYRLDPTFERNFITDAIIIIKENPLRIVDGKLRAISFKASIYKSINSENGNAIEFRRLHARSLKQQRDDKERMATEIKQHLCWFNRP